MCKMAALLSKGLPTAIVICKYSTLLPKGSNLTIMYKHFPFKGPPTSLISSASYFIWEFEAFFGELSSDGTDFWAPVTAWAPNWG